MTVADLRHWEPTLDIVPARGFRDQVIPNFRDRVVSFQLEDDFRKPLDKCTLVLNNNDGALMDVNSLALGITFSISFGYFGGLAPPRLMQCRKMKGAFRIGGLGPESAPNTTAGGTVTLELLSQVWNMNMFRAVSSASQGEQSDIDVEQTVTEFSDGDLGFTEKRQLLFVNKSVSDIIRILAQNQGFNGPSLLVQDLENEPVYDDYVIPADFSDAEWISDKANERGWVFAIDDDGFHFHNPNFEPSNIEPVRLGWFNGDPDVLHWSIDGDLNIPQNVQVRGSERRTEFIIGVSQGTRRVGSESAENGFNRNTLVINDKGPGGKRLSPDLLLATSDPSRKQVARIERILSRAENRWKLKMTLVGNPRLKARRTVDLHNFGPLVDGKWFIRKAIHKYAANQVYLTEIEARRKGPGGAGLIKYAIGVTHGTLGVGGGQQRGSVLIQLSGE